MDEGRTWALRPVAERVGFEPTDGCPSLVFKTSPLNRSGISPAIAA